MMTVNVETCRLTYIAVLVKYIFIALKIAFGRQNNVKVDTVIKLSAGKLLIAKTDFPSNCSLLSRVTV
jgi:hypothetical protein